MSKGIYYTTIHIFKNGKEITFDDSILIRNAHYGEKPKEVETRPYACKELFPIYVQTEAEHRMMHNAKCKLKDTLDIKIDYVDVDGLFGKAKYYAQFDDHKGHQRAIKFRPYDCFEFYKEVVSLDNRWGLKEVLSYLPTAEIREYLQDFGFLPVDASMEIFTKFCTIMRG